MPLTVGDVVNSARLTLIDSAKVTWSDAELIAYTNEGVEATCFGKPDAYILQAAVALAVGVTQTLPAGSTGLSDITRNTASGNAVTQVDKALLEAADPGWGAMGAQIDVEHYTYDPRNPLRFLVYPPAAAGASVEMARGAVPAPVAALSDAFPLVDTYGPPLIDYVLSRAYAKNSKKQDLSKTSLHKQAWAAALGLRAQAQLLAAPKIADGAAT